MKIIRFIVIVFFFFCSCSNELKIKERLLTDDNYCYWDIVHSKVLDYNKDSARIFPYYCFYFDNKGTFYFLYYDNGKRVLSRGRDIPTEDCWSFVNDSTILINGLSQKILKLDRDSLILFNSTKCVRSIIK